MAVMRSIMYVPGNNPKMVEKAPSIPADIITLDLEDSVPPSEKEAARKLVAEKLKYAGSGGAQVYVRINNWETEMTNDDLEAVVWEGLDGVTLAKTGHPDDVKRLDWKLEELERRRGIPVGTVKISMLLETAKGIMNAYECCMASSRNVNAIFGAVDYCREQAAKLTNMGFRVTVDDRSEKIGKKIRDGQMEKVPYMLIVGDRDIEAGTVSPRHRTDGDLGAMTLDAFAAQLREVVDSKAKK